MVLERRERRRMKEERGGRSRPQEVARWRPESRFLERREEDTERREGLVISRLVNAGWIGEEKLRG